MEKSRRSAGHHRMYLIVGVIALAATLGFRPGAARASCVGDCDGGGSVTVNEIIVLVNIALGSALPSACPNGIPSGSTVNVALIIQAVNNDLNSTCVVSPTPTPTPGVGPAVCGDGVVTPPEECDDGGICIGGPSAGTACTAESQCSGTTGVCIGGENYERVCSVAADCPHGTCRKCVPFGGDGCAANCTTETDVQFVFSSASNSQVNTELFGVIPLPLTGSDTMITGNADANGIITSVVKAASVQVPKIDVGGLACACVRGIAAKTCGGTVFEADGSLAVDCTPDYSAGDSVCTDQGKNPCTYVNGPGNSAAGITACSTAGLDGANFNYFQDSNGSLDSPQCADQPGLGDPECAKAPILTLSGHGDRGSIVNWNTQAIGTVTGSCDQFPTFCTDADAISDRGTPATTAQVTNSASCNIININGEDGVNLPNSPFTVRGTPFNCDTLSISGLTLASTFTAPNQATTLDIAVTTILQAQ